MQTVEGSQVLAYIIPTALLDCGFIITQLKFFCDMCTSPRHQHADDSNSQL